jgi:hypothetical protein
VKTLLPAHYTISLPKLLADGVSNSFHTPVQHGAELCFLSVIMYSIGVVILSIVGKRLSAKLNILLVIGTCIMFDIPLRCIVEHSRCTRVH